MEQPVLQHKEKLISDKTLYHKYKLWVIEKEIRLRLSQDTLEVKTYNENGEKVLIQQYENNKVTYRCEYKRRKNTEKNSVMTMTEMS